MNSFKKVFLVLFISLIFVLIGGVVLVDQAYAISPAITFSRSLNIGDYGDDVLELQRVLNEDPETRVAASGPGSPGQETQYFGSLTRDAVIKYQNKYSDEILAPVGLTYGTGYFGPSTISYIQKVQDNRIASEFQTESEIQLEDGLLERILEILNQTDTNVESEPETPDVPDVQVNTNTTESDDGFTISYISQNVAEYGDEIAVVSADINSTSAILLKNSSGERTVYGDVFTSGIYFDVPRVSYGTYDLYIKNGTELSEPVTLRIVRDINAPKISTLSYPGTYIEHGDTITIRGERLGGENTVMTPLGKYIVNSTSDTQFSFVLEKQFELQNSEDFSNNIFDGFIQLRNYNGDSNLKSVKFIYD